MNKSRRQFIKSVTAFGAASSLFPNLASADHHLPGEKNALFEISIAQWSLHKALFAKELTNLDFPAKAKEFGIHAVEFVNQFFKDKANDAEYLKQLIQRCDDNGVKSLLIMCDGEGQLGDPDEKKRAQAVDNHKKWLDAAKTLGCHSIRVNAASGGSFDEQKERAADGLRKLSEIAKGHELNVIVENHGGLSSNGEWLAATIKSVGLDNCGTLPDFGNFTIDRNTGEQYDRYKGVKELMPFAKGVSAKSHDFDAEGNETHTDYRKMLKIVLDAGYKGYIGIEYEGGKISEAEGIIATRKLLEKVRTEMS
jgi:L-ribulose-5-phosphate 3-epimerase